MHDSSDWSKSLRVEVRGDEVADGTDCIADARVLVDQPPVFGPVASIPTMWRSLNEIDHAALARITMAHATRFANACGSRSPHGTGGSRRVAPATVISAQRS